MLTPVIFFTLMIGVIDGFQYFDQAFVAGNTASGQSSTLGNPQGSLLFYSLWIYQQAFVDFHMGYASALAWVLFLATMCVTAVLLLDLAPLGALPREPLMTATAVKPPEVRQRRLPVAIRRRRLLLRVGEPRDPDRARLAFLFPIFFMLARR